MEGELQLHGGEPAWAAVLKAGDECVKLALPEGFYVDSQQWNGEKVKVSGRVFRQPNLDYGGDAVPLWYTEQDRKLALGICDDGLGIYVNSMWSRSGEAWPKD